MRLCNTPFRRWLYHQIVSGQDADGIVTLCPVYGIYGITYFEKELPELILKVRKEVSQQGEFAYRKSHGLVALSKPDLYEEMSSISHVGDTRRTIEVLTYAGLTAADIANSLPGLTDSVRGIKLMQIALLDTSNLSLADVTTYYRVIKHPDMYLIPSVYGRGYEFAMWKLGKRIEFNHSEMADVLAHEAGMRALETQTLPAIESTARSFAAYINAYIDIQRHRKEGGSEVDKVVDSLKNFALKTSRSETPRLSDVSAGADSLTTKQASRQNGNSKR